MWARVAWYLGREDSLEEGMATHSGILAWRIPWTEEPTGLHGLGHNWTTFTFIAVSFYLERFSSVRFSPVQPFATPWTAACQASLSITNSQSLLKLMSIESVMPSNHLILCRSLLLTSIFLSIRVFSNESVLRIRWPKYWSFKFSSSPSDEYSGLISSRMDWLDLLAVQGTLEFSPTPQFKSVNSTESYRFFLRCDLDSAN